MSGFTDRTTWPNSFVINSVDSTTFVNGASQVTFTITPPPNASPLSWSGHLAVNRRLSGPAGRIPYPVRRGAQSKRSVPGENVAAVYTGFVRPWPTERHVRAGELHDPRVAERHACQPLRGLARDPDDPRMVARASVTNESVASALCGRDAPAGCRSNRHAAFDWEPVQFLHPAALRHGPSYYKQMAAHPWTKREAIRGRGRRRRSFAVSVLSVASSESSWQSSS